MKLTVKADQDSVSLQLSDVDHARLGRVCTKTEGSKTLTTKSSVIFQLQTAAQLLSPASVNHEEVELGLTVPNLTTWLSSVPLLTATQMRG